MEELKENDLHYEARIIIPNQEEEEDEFFYYLSQIHDVNDISIDIDQMSIFFQLLLSENEEERIYALYNLYIRLQKFPKQLSEYYGSEHFLVFCSFLENPDIFPLALVSLQGISSCHPHFIAPPNFFPLLLSIFLQNDEAEIYEYILNIAGNLFTDDNNLLLGIESFFIQNIIQFEFSPQLPNLPQLYELKLWMLSCCLFSDTPIATDILNYLVQFTPIGYDQADVFILVSFDHALFWSQYAFELLKQNPLIFSFAYSLLSSESRARQSALEFIHQCLKKASVLINPNQLFAVLIERFINVNDDDENSNSLTFQKHIIEIFSDTLIDSSIEVQQSFLNVYQTVDPCRFFGGKPFKITSLLINFITKFAQNNPIVFLSIFNIYFAEAIIDLIETSQENLIVAITTLFGTIFPIIITVPEKAFLLQMILNKSGYLGILNEYVPTFDLEENDPLFIYQRTLLEFSKVYINC